MEFLDFDKYFQALLMLISRVTLEWYCSTTELRCWILPLEIGLHSSYARRFPAQAFRRFLSTCLLLPEELGGLARLVMELERLLWKRKIRIVKQIRIFQRSALAMAARAFNTLVLRVKLKSGSYCQPPK